MSRKRGPVELPEFASMVRRVIRAFSARTGDADPEDLVYMLGIRSELDTAILEAVYGQHVRYGRSWTEIGKAVGITRQSAYERWGTDVRRLMAERGVHRKPIGPKPVLIDHFCAYGCQHQTHQLEMAR